MPQPLYPWGKRHWYPVHRRLGRSQSNSCRDKEEKNPHCCWELNPIIQAIA